MTVIAGDDPRPWRMLGDGTIVGIDREGDVIGVTIELRAIRVRFLLAGCDAIRYQPHDEPVLYELPDIAASEPDIRGATPDHGAMVVTGGAGSLRLAYANLAIEIDGERIELAELGRRLGRTYA